MHEALLGGRRLDVLLRRNLNNDSSTKDTSYAGFDFCWENGVLVQVNLLRLCGIGVRLVFGKQVPSKGSFQVQFHLVPVDDPYSKRLPVPRAWRPRRIYFERIGSRATLHLANGFCTDVYFDEKDDPRVVEWVGLRDLSPGQRQWADLLAICDQVSSSESDLVVPVESSTSN